MKTANAALLIAAGILLLWVVMSQRTKNLAASWNALLGANPSAPTQTGAGAAAGASSVAPSSIVGLNAIPQTPTVGVPSTEDPWLAWMDSLYANDGTSAVFKAANAPNPFPNPNTSYLA